ncbi:MAG: Xaa-Pro aminopeptidase [Thalassotalea sp.]
MKNTLLSVDEFIARRALFLAQMPANAIALFPAAHEVTRSNDTEYLFCQNKNFYYLTGFNEPDALLVLIKAGEGVSDDQSMLFCRNKDPLQEVWHGRRVGHEQAKIDYGFDHADITDHIDIELPDLLDGKSQVLYCHGEFPAFEEQLSKWLSGLRTAVRQGKKAPKILADCTDTICEMRLFKSPAELDIMRKANVISGHAHQRAMEKTSAEKFEYQIEAEILHEFARNGARYTAYNSIVAGGDNANILHYTDNQDQLQNGDLLLIDAGAELAGYAADITRTFPVNGRFNQPQAALYQLVLDAQNKAIEAIKPQQTLGKLNEITCEILTKGMHDLGILTGDLATLLADNACKKYFIHGLGHWLGLDVHDVGDYHIDANRKQSRLFQPGMVMTIEPGLYIPSDDVDVDEKWRGIGIRIEDNILVTESGYENLTTTAPKTIAAIEALMAK